MDNRENEHIEFKKSTGELKEAMISLVSMYIRRAKICHIPLMTAIIFARMTKTMS